MFLSVSCLLAVLATPPAPSPLAARLQPLIQAHKGQVAVGVKHLETGETFFHNPDLVLPTASLIKVAVFGGLIGVICAYHGLAVAGGPAAVGRAGNGSEEE